MTKSKDPKPPRPKRAGPTGRTNPTTGAFQISDELWEVLAPLIPERVNTHRFGGARPRVPDRTCANGIFYVLRTGCQWKALGRHGHLFRLHRPSALSGMGCRWGISGTVAGGAGTLRRTEGSGLELA